MLSGTLRHLSDLISQSLKLHQTAPIFDLWKKQTQFQTVKDDSQKTLSDLQTILARSQTTGGDSQTIKTVFWSIQLTSRTPQATSRRLSATSRQPSLDDGRSWSTRTRLKHTSLCVWRMVPDCLNIASNRLMNASHRLEL